MLSPGCPRCSLPLVDLVAAPDRAPGAAAGWACPEHGVVVPLWRSDAASYDDLAAHLLATPDFPTYLPWPMSPGWSVTDLAHVGGPERTLATATCCSGPSDADGPVDALVVTEEAGTGLGARVAGSAGSEPRPDLSIPPLVRVRIGSHTVPLWAVAPSGSGLDLDRSVVAGEAFGRWLWVVLRPASALLLLSDVWILRDVSGLGPTLVEVPFAHAPPAW